MSGYAGAPLPGPNSPGVQEILDALTGRGADQDDMGEGAPAREDRVDRKSPQPDEARRKLVARWQTRVRADKKFHATAFKRVAADMAFVNGRGQWDHDGTRPPGAKETRYVANIALRHVRQRTASLYASNPKVIAAKRERMMATIWDGDMATIAKAQQELQNAAMQQAQTAAMTGVPVPPGGVPPGVSPNTMAVLTDFHNVQTYDKMLKRVGKTLELLWDFNVAEQTYPFKAMMKQTVRRTVVAGFAYVKLGFQRSMKMNPEIETRIADDLARLATIQQIADDIADGETPRDSADAEQLKLSVQALMDAPKIITREGLLFDYPDSTAIIPDKKCKSLRGFLGADWVTQEYMLTADQIQQIYHVDVGSGHRSYSADGTPGRRGSTETGGGDGDGDDDSLAAVWESYHRADGLVYVTCDGYGDFLQEPATPEVYLDQFFPWFVMMLNEGYDEEELFPQSDVFLIRDMQLELNRSRQALREHRRANRPKTAVAAGVLEENDKEKLRSHPANALIELNGLAPGQRIEDLLQVIKGAPIDPALYDTNGSFEDLLRVIGADQASMGQTTSASATEASIAQGSQHTDLASSIDDQDDLLTALARAAGKLLLMNVSAATVQRVIGPGAVWPELSREEIVENIYLTIQAGSTGRPNKQQEIQNAQILFPMLQRVPGISPEWMARELIKRMDDRLDLTEAFAEGVPSMDALNRIQGTVATPPPADPQNSAPPPGPAQNGGGGAPVAPPMGGASNDPTAQGDQGVRNAVAPPPINGLLGPRMPPYPGANGLTPGHGGGPANTPQGALPTP